MEQWMENERQRLINLRDRASEKGRKKEYPLKLKIVNFKYSSIIIYKNLM